jgi:hypothetical protein
VRFYAGQQQYYCGGDLHARTLYVCVLDDTGPIRLHTRLLEPVGSFELASQLPWLDAASRSRSRIGSAPHPSPELTGTELDPASDP